MRNIQLLILLISSFFAFSQNTTNTTNIKQMSKKQIDTTLFDNTYFELGFYEQMKNNTNKISQLLEYIVKNTEYPEKSKENSESGITYIQIFFNKELKKDSIKVYFSSNYKNLDISALKVINNTPDSLFANAFKTTTNNYIIIPISFVLSGIKTIDPIDTELKNAEINLLKGNFLKAKEQYDNILKVDKHNVIALNNRALTTYYLLDYFNACQDWYYAYHLGYKSAANMYYNYCNQEILVKKYIYDADSLMNKNDFAEAEKRYDIVNMINPFDTTVITNRAICYYNMGNLVSSCNELDTAISLGSVNAYNLSKKICTDNAWFGYYSIQLRKSLKEKDYKQAISNLTELIKLQENNPNLYYQKAEIFLKQGKRQEACKSINKALEKGFNNSNIDLNKYCDE